MRVAVIGHVEWVHFVRVERVPLPGEIVAAMETWEEPAGGGAVAAGQLLKLAGEATFYTALGDDELGHRAKQHLERMGLRVEAVFRDRPQRRAFTFVDANGERTITTIGERLAPSGDDPLPWGELRTTDAVYFTAGDRGALQHGRKAKALVATSRILKFLAEAGVLLDALVGSGRDPSEKYLEGMLNPTPQLVVRTFADEGGTYRIRDGVSGRFDPAPLPGPISDAYGAGDSFAAGLAYGLGAGYSTEEALALAARCGAAAMTRRGAYGGQFVVTGRTGSRPPR